MNSTLKPVLPAPAQNAGTATATKPMHPQGTPISYGQPSGPISQNPFPNTNMAHNHPSTQQNHFSLNVPGVGTHFSMGTIPASNHPVAISQPPSGQNYNPPKNVYSGFQHGVGLSTQNQNTLPPVSQTLPATTTTTTTSSAASQSPAVTQNLSNSNSNTSNSSVKEPAVEKDKAQPNGTPEVELPAPAKPEKTEVQGNHVPTQPPTSVPQAPQPQEKPTSQTPSPQQPSEKPKLATPPQEKKPPQEPKPAPEPKPVQEPPKVPDEPVPAQKISQPPSIPTPQTVSVPAPEPANKAPVPSSEPVDTEPVQNDAESVKDVPETDPLAFDGSGVVPDEKPTQTPDGAVPIIQSEDVKEDSEGDDKSSAEEQSSEESESEKGPKDEESAMKTPVRKAKVPKTEPKSAIQKSPSSSKTKRQRMRTQHYQSPLPEIEIITKITAAPPRNRNTDDKLIYFYKNEFLAVRNAEGGFYLCQAVQNIYKSSSKIKIRWLSQDKNEKTAEIYTPDFYDTTDFDCILTSLDLTRVGKGRYKLKPAEKLRTDSILKRCLAVEKGEISQPSVSAEHPDGLDLSLYKDEEQLLKKKTKQGQKRKSRPRSLSPKKATPPTKQSPEAPKARRVEYKPTRQSTPAKKPAVKKAVAQPEPKKATPTTSRAARGKRKAMAKTSPVVDQKKAKVLAKIGRKAAVPAASTKAPAQTSKSAKVSKPAPSSSKVSKPSPAAKLPPRKAKRSGRK